MVLCLSISLSIATFLAGAPAAASSGSLVGEVCTTEGEHITRAAVKIDGPGGELETTTDDEGRFRFRQVRPGKYSLTVRRDGRLLSRYDGVNVRLGRPTSVKVRVAAKPEETLVVTLEPPSPSPRSTLDGDRARDPDDAGLASGLTTVSAELDPFAAGDGISVRALDGRRGGSEGAAREDDVLSDDAPSIPRPLDDAVRRLDRAASVQTPAATGERVIELLTQRPHTRRNGSLRLDASDRDWNDGADKSVDNGTDGATTHERIAGLRGAGFDLGQAVVDDRLWAWIGYETQSVERIALGGQETRSDLEEWAVELRTHLGPSLSWVIGHHRGDREERGAGAGVDRSLEATRLELQPSELSTATGTWMASPHVHYRFTYSSADDAASLLPFGTGTTLASGGLDPIRLDGDGVWRGGFAEIHRRQDVDTYGLRAELEPRSLRGRHLLRFGYERKDLVDSDRETWGAANAQLLAGENFGTPFDLLRVRRSGELAVDRELMALWIEESVTFDRLSLDLGLRRDQQVGAVAAGRLDANPLLPELLPAVHDDGRSTRLAWTDLHPRVSATWAFGSERRTLARLGWGRFASRLDRDLVSRVSPLSGAELTFAFDGDEPLQLLFGGAGGAGGFGDAFLLVDQRGVDPLQPAYGSPSQNAPDLRSETTEELRLSMEHHAGRALRLWASYLDRETRGVHESRLFLRQDDGEVRLARAADYRLETVIEGVLPDGTPWSAPVYGLAEGLELTGGRWVENGDRERREARLTVGFDRPMGDGFQLRGHAAWSEWTWSVGPEFAAFDDPTNAAPGLDPDGLPTADDDGGVVTTAPGRYFAGARWSFDLTGLFDVAPRKPWGFGVAASLQGREGLPIPYALDVVGDDGVRRVQAGENILRLDDVVTLDLRLEKELVLGSLRSVVSLDTYNLLDSGAVLEREPLLGGPQADAVRRTLSPRVFRLGLRIALP